MALKALFCSFSLERHVPADRMLRSINRFVGLSCLREHLQPFYADPQCANAVDTCAAYVAIFRAVLYTHNRASLAEALGSRRCPSRCDRWTMTRQKGSVDRHPQARRGRRNGDLIRR